MEEKALVSVIIPFWNIENFIEEAINSVFAQSYDHWELLLVDDGSTDRSTGIAQGYASRYPEQVFYLEHADHQNLGASASRNLGAHHAKGDYIAFLDADDIWYPQKLERQLAILETQPEAGMLYGLTQYWYSWTGKPDDLLRDTTPELGVPLNTVLRPPSLITPFFLKQVAAIPSLSNIIMRREVIERVGGFEESFRRVYTDQTFYAKACLVTSMLASSECWDRYRQHRDSSCSITEKEGEAIKARLLFLRWLSTYLTNQGYMTKDVKRLLQREIWMYRFPIFLSLFRNRSGIVQRTKNRSLQIASRIIPAIVRRWLLAYWRNRKNVTGIGQVEFGGLRRTTPISQDWGFDRGLPVDRYYIENFLTLNDEDIRGCVLEIMDDSYTWRFGGEKVSHSDVLSMESSPKATIVGDLTCADHIPSNAYDCVILTQTIHLIYDVRAALRTVYRILKPGGVLLLTVPGISQISRYDADRWGDCWRFTTRSAHQLLEELFPASDVHVSSHGNVLVATALMYGLATSELHQNELDHHDPDYQVLITARAVKPSSDQWVE